MIEPDILAALEMIEKITDHRFCRWCYRCGKCGLMPSQIARTVSKYGPFMAMCEGVDSNVGISDMTGEWSEKLENAEDR